MKIVLRALGGSGNNTNNNNTQCNSFFVQTPQMNSSVMHTMPATVNTPHSKSSFRTSNPNFTKNDEIVINIPIDRNSSSSISQSPTILNSGDRKLQTILDIKNYLSSCIQCKVDSICLFSIEQGSKNSFITLSDTEEIENLKHLVTNFTLYLYYKISLSNPFKLIIIVNQLNIDKIIFEVSEYCSVFMLKNLINKKLNNSHSIKEIGIFAMEDTLACNNKLINSSFLNSSNQNNNFSQEEFGSKGQELKDDFIISTLEVEEIKLLMIIKKEKKCSIGIDFSFNLLKDIRKIKFEEEAPSYREVSDGVSLFLYCKNKDCKIFKQLFVKNFGYGKFDLIKEIRMIQCLKCRNEKSKVEAKNIGFVNCEWTYKGMLINKKSSYINGDGITIDSKLHILKETNLLSQLERLEIEVKEHKLKYKYEVESSSEEESARLNSFNEELQKEKEKMKNKENKQIITQNDKEMNNDEKEKLKNNIEIKLDGDSSCLSCYKNENQKATIYPNKCIIF
jgi:hypothetical protein